MSCGTTGGRGNAPPPNSRPKKNLADQLRELEEEVESADCLEDDREFLRFMSQAIIDLELGLAKYTVRDGQIIRLPK